MTRRLMKASTLFDASQAWPRSPRFSPGIEQLEEQASLELRASSRSSASSMPASPARDEAKRGSDMIPQSELLAKLQRQIDDLKRVADLKRSCKHAQVR